MNLNDNPTTNQIIHRTLKKIWTSSAAMTMPSDARSYIVCCYKQPTGLSKKRRQPAAATLFSDVRSSIAHCYKQPTGLLVGLTGFEPATSCSQSRRATKLRYSPNAQGHSYLLYSNLGPAMTHVFSCTRPFMRRILTCSYIPAGYNGHANGGSTAIRTAERPVREQKRKRPQAQRQRQRRQTKNTEQHHYPETA